MRLSICIPTHHGRGRFLAEAISSLLLQKTEEWTDQVEICVSDNASEDETCELMTGYIRGYPGLFHYYRHPANLGFTRNLIHLITLAQGDYCWLFSSDDVMAPGAVALILEMLAQHPNTAGMTVDFRSYDREMKQIVGESHPPILLPDHPEEKQVFTSPGQIFRACGSVQGNFSMQIFDRRLWQEAAAETGTAKISSFRYFPYLYLFGLMVRKRPMWIWLPEKLVQSRTQNDFLSGELGRSMLRYHTVTMQEVAQIWRELFGRSSATYQSLMFDNYHVFWSAWSIIVYKGRYPCTLADEIKAVVVFARNLSFLPGFWATGFPALLVPQQVPKAGLAFLRRTGLGRRLRACKRRFFSGAAESS